MQTPEAAYMDVKNYLLDLDARIQQSKEWDERHPDMDSIPYMFDAMSHYRDPDAFVASGKSTFDPNDPEIQTADVFTSERLVDILTVLVAAFETRRRD